MQSLPKVTGGFLCLQLCWILIDRLKNGTKDSWTVKRTRATGTRQDQRLTAPISARIHHKHQSLTLYFSETFITYIQIDYKCHLEIGQCHKRGQVDKNHNMNVAR